MRSYDGTPGRTCDMAETRAALVVANDQYDDPGLTRLVAPAQDAAALADVLADPSVGGFTVQVLRNASAQEIRFAVEDFFADRRPEDLLLLHFSCHGLKNAAGELFLAVADTKPTRLASTAVAADFVNRQMADSRAQRIALFLDCCYGGAFPRGMVVRAAGEAQVRDAFAGQADVGGGRGRVVVTASSAMEYAFEGGQLATDATPAPSVFTGAVVDGLTTGEADRDGDGWVGLTELVGYVTDRVHRVTPNQNPQMWTFGSQGELLIARSRVRRITPTPLAPELTQAMESPLPAARFGVVDYLRERLFGDDLGQAYAAWQALHRMLDDDSRRVSEAATNAIAAAELVVTPPEILLTGAVAELRLEGPPIALTAAASASAPWLKVEQDGAIVTVRADEPREDQASVTVSGPVGELTVPVRVTLPDTDTDTEPPPPPPEPEAEQPPPLAEPPTIEPADEVPTEPPSRVPWWVVVVLVAGAVVLVYLNWPGEAASRKIWSDADSTGWYVYRSSGDPVIVSSFAALLLGLAARWSGPVALGVLAGCLAALLEDSLLILVGGISSDESTKLFGIWTDETTAWLLTGAIAAAMAAVLLLVLWPGRWPRWPVPRVPAILAGMGGVLLLVSALIQNSSGVSFFTVTRLAVLEPFVAVALTWLALAAVHGRARTWLTAATTTYAVVGIIATIPAMTEGGAPAVFIAAMVGNALVIAAVLSRVLRLPSRP
ncbi:caspase family protein [Kribbella sindirgiensis]|uniref:Caspase family protein n=1 Tax=Kribbella sindirgiensis TaxID=1124744 RepID=A0A4R0IHE4_9ACTN|nr:caspase family protein [Kribbella sindirgiensis]TCC31550.1 caspase family protein [Kribbella sindirgiensis]